MKTFTDSFPCKRAAASKEVIKSGTLKSKVEIIPSKVHRRHQVLIDGYAIFISRITTDIFNVTINKSRTLYFEDDIPNYNNQRVCNKISNSTGVNGGGGAFTYPSEALVIPPVNGGVCFAHSLVLYFELYILLFVYCSFLLCTMELSVYL